MSVQHLGAGEVFGERAELAVRYAELLANEGVEWGLLGPREVARIWDRHVMNSASLCGLVGAGASVVDVGSGAGLPGIVLALARPDVSVWLLEPLARRVKFLRLVIGELGLGEQVRVIRGRAERPGQWECAEGTSTSFDLVTCRAVAGFEQLVSWCWPLVAKGGELAAMKGSGAEREVDQAGPLLEKRKLTAILAHVRAWPGAEATWVVRVRGRSVK